MKRNILISRQRQNIVEINNQQLCFHTQNIILHKNWEIMYTNRAVMQVGVYYPSNHASNTLELWI